MTPQQFVTKWSKIQQKETAVAHTHFNDICALVGHLPPLAFDPEGHTFAFESRTLKPDERKGFADVYFRDHFIWEYKGPHKDLGKAYAQLQLYRESLDNPPLLITSDIHTIIIHTNFNNYPTVKHTITFDDLLTGDGVEKLRWAFFTPERFRPEKTQAEITQANANTFVSVADAMKKHQQITGETYSAEQLAHFMGRLLFCLFAEDLELLPNNVFTEMVAAQSKQNVNLQYGLRNLFREMRGGGVFAFYNIREFDGTLFDDTFVPTIPDDLARALLKAAEQDWSQVDPAIFGTLFERVIDDDKRAQLGAHYTGVNDILLIVEPVLMAPLRHEWAEVRLQTQGVDNDTAAALLQTFADKLAAVRILDPACGSGNFLYVALRQLLDLQKEVIAYANRRGLPPIPLTVSPQQLYGLEVNVYAHELAQITSWIGYLQWRYENGFEEMADPILRPLHNIKRMDAILAYNENGDPIEPEWPATDIIVGNPPFLGGNKIRQELGDETVDALFELYEDVPSFSDLVCYWFEKARREIARQRAYRAGLVATNSISGGINKRTLERIKQSGDIFMAWKDRPWMLDGAAVRIALVGFDDGTENGRTLDGEPASQINPDLTGFSFYISGAHKLAENGDICFMGASPKGAFDISAEVAHKMLTAVNPTGVSNADVVRPVMSATDIVRRSRELWTIDFGMMSEEEAAQYERPFAYVKKHVYPVRSQNRRAAYAKNWWLYAENRPGMRRALQNLPRYIATPAVAKHRLFVWVTPNVLCNQGCLVFARGDDYFWGVLHAKVHEIWSLYKGTSLEDRPRYTPTTTFETFPLPFPPGREPADDPRVQAIAQWAQRIDQWRNNWLNPPPPADNVVDVAYEKRVKSRTLTNLYNGLAYYRHKRPFSPAEFAQETRNSISRASIEELHDLHTLLDRAVLDAYGWPHSLTDEEILARLLQLNAQRAQSS